MTSYLSPRNLAKSLLPFERIKHDELWVLSVTIKALCFHYIEGWMYINATCLMGGDAS